MIQIRIVLAQDKDGLVVTKPITSSVLIKFPDSLSDAEVSKAIEDALWQRMNKDGFNYMNVVEALVECKGYEALFKRSPSNMFLPRMWVHQ